MSDLTERAYDVAWYRVKRQAAGRLHSDVVEIAVEALAEAGMLADPDVEDPHDWWRSLDQHPAASADSLMEHAPDTARAVARYDAASVARVRRLLRDAYRRKTLRTDDVRVAIEGDRP